MCCLSFALVLDVLCVCGVRFDVFVFGWVFVVHCVLCVLRSVLLVVCCVLFFRVYCGLLFVLVVFDVCCLFPLLSLCAVCCDY